MLRGNQAKNPNERPDKDAPSDDPLVSQSSREKIILKTLQEFEKSGFAGDGSSDRGGWVFHRQREDKKEPNFSTVAINRWRSIVGILS